MKNKSRTSLMFFSCSRFLADNVSKLRSRNNKLVTFATDGTPLKYFVIKFFNLVRLFCNSKYLKGIARVDCEWGGFLFCHSLAAISEPESNFITALHVIESAVGLMELSIRRQKLRRDVIKSSYVTVF